MQNDVALSMVERLRATPVQHPRMVRPDIVRTVTSADAGYAVPLGFIPLHREDALETTRAQATVYMAETADLLLNTVHCVFSAYLVPKLAFDRFGGSLDALNRAYMGQDEMDGSRINWIETHDMSANLYFYKAAGLHTTAANQHVNTDFFEAYWKVFEHRCRMRSEALWEVAKNIPSTDLAPAFFDNPQMAMVKASFDQDQMEGAVPLEFLGDTSKLSVYSTATGNPPNGNRTVGQVGTPEDQPDGSKLWQDVWAELSAEGVQVTLANIDLARETQIWARVRNQYSGIDDDDLIDLLMAGVRIPTLEQTKPILLDRQRVPFGMTQRYSSEAEHLDVSATNGRTGATLTMRTPQLNTGGVVVIIAEVVPEQFWERSRDYWLLSDNDTRRPDRLLDSIDPQAVELVENTHADVKHSDPNGVFGYAPLNHAYVRRRFNLGGKFWKDNPNAPWTQDRNRIWASEPVDPTLSYEFWLATDLPKEIFMDQNVDTFEFSLACDASISGNTYIGPALREAQGDYRSIMDRVDLSRVTPATPAAIDAVAQSDGGDPPPATEEVATGDDEVAKGGQDDAA